MIDTNVICKCCDEIEIQLTALEAYAGSDDITNPSLSTLIFRASRAIRKASNKIYDVVEPDK